GAAAAGPDVVEPAPRHLDPHRIVFHALDLAGAFHRYYNRQRILTEDRASTHARLALVRAVQRVLRGALGLAGVTAPERMRREAGWREMGAAGWGGEGG